MRVLIAPDRFGDLLTATEVAQALADGWADAAPWDEVDLCPMSAGGVGFLDAITHADGRHEGGGWRTGAKDQPGTEVAELTVCGPWGDPTPASVVVRTDPDGVRTAYLEAAQACGAHLAAMPTDVGRGVVRASSHGVGELLQAALGTDARRIVVGCGPAATHDGGAGALAALDAGPASLLGRGGEALTDLPEDALAGLDGVRARFGAVDLVVATDSTVPLLGFHGVSATCAQERGASPEQAQQLEVALGRLSDVARRSLVAGRPLSGRGQAGDVGSGASGGLAFALMLLGARRVAGAQAVLDAVGFRSRVARCELALSAERCFDRTSLSDQVVSMVSSVALDRGLPTVVVAGTVDVGRRESLALGIAATSALADRPEQIPATGAVVARAVQGRARRLARTWSSRPT